MCYETRKQFMRRFKKAGLAFTVVGALAAATVTDRDGFVLAFFVFFFGGIAAAVALLSAGRWNAADPDIVNIPNPDPFIDDLGVHHSSPVASSILRTVRPQPRVGGAEE